MSNKKNTFLVSKIKKIRVKDVDEVLYLVKWFNEPEDTWEPKEHFTENVELYPGYYKALNNIYRVRNKYEKNAVQILIHSFNQ